MRGLKWRESGRKERGREQVIARIQFVFSLPRYLSWANYLHTVQVKTVQTPRPPPAARRLSQGHNSTEHLFTRLPTIAVFNILPLELVTCFSVDRHVRPYM